MTALWLAGVDGCAGGWMVARARPGFSEIAIWVFPDFRAVLSASGGPLLIAIDIPVGLPDRASAGGRCAENAVRPLLGARQSSVFSVPSRAAIEAPDYAGACAIAAATSDPPRKVSRQLFGIAAKIREVDAVLRADAAVAAHVYEVHPELAFWQMNGGRALGEPKKVQGRCFAPGLALRRGLLIAAGLPPDAVGAPLPKGARADDLLDALACLVIAGRIHAGIARPFPDPPPRDAYGLPMAIWA